MTIEIYLNALDNVRMKPMKEDSIINKHRELEKELRTNEFGRFFLKFLCDFTNNKPDWIFSFAQNFNLDLKQENVQEHMQFNALISNIIKNDSPRFVNLRSFTNLLIEVDFLIVGMEIVMYVKFERKSITNMDLKDVFISLSKYKFDYEIQTKLTTEEIIEKLHQIVVLSSEKDCFSGNVLITENNKTLFEISVGYANLRYMVKNNLETKFNLASMNKIFTTVAILQLYEKKKLNLQEPIKSIFPEFPNGDIITPHHLLSHTSGLGSFWNKRYREKYVTIKSIDDYLELFIDEPLLFKPGEKFEYSNSGYIVLGKIIENITSLSYEEYIQKNIFEKANMSNTACYEIDDIVPNLAIGYTHKDYEETKFDPNKLMSNIFIVNAKGSSAGGGYSTVTDLTNFALALENGELISKESLQLMKNPHSGIIEGNDGDYGYGCQLGKIRDAEWYGHGGGANGIATMMMIIPEKKSIVVILTNKDPFYEVIVEQQIINILERYLG